MERWSKEKAQAWWDAQKWPVGFNYVTSDAVNDIEMWMDATFHPSLIQQELLVAARLGLNSARVFLSYAVWLHEGEKFLGNFETFLNLAADAGLSVVPVLFDDCAFDFGKEPEYGPQPGPVPGVHNSRWVPSPGFGIQDDPENDGSLKEYIQTIVGRHCADSRILAWNLYNEPGNSNRNEKAIPLLQKVFEWARSCEPEQPLMADIWMLAPDSTVDKWCAENSDVLSLHMYTPYERTCELIGQYKELQRPLLVTEWMHRPAGSTILTHLPMFHREKIGVWQWGMLKGRTQTNLSWDTMNGGTPNANPVLWQHDLLHPDGMPYDQAEVDLIGELSRKQ